MIRPDEEHHENVMNGDYDVEDEDEIDDDDDDDENCIEIDERTLIAIIKV